MRKTNRTRDDFGSKLIQLVLPIAFQQFMLAAVSASDAVMLGMVDQNSLSAVSLAGQVQFVFSLFLSAMTTGINILAAQYWGQRNVNAVERIFAIVFRISTVISGIFFAAALCIPGCLMRIFTSDVRLIASGTVYLRAVGLSYLLCGMSQIFLGIMKNTGHVLQSTIISTTAVVTNIVLNAVFIFGIGPAPKLGIAGAALATVLARAIELIWVVLDSHRSSRVKLKVQYLLHTDKLLKKDFWKYTAPVLMNLLIWGIGFTMYSVIMGHLGSDAVAANAIANIARNLIACFCMGIGSGGAIIVGNALGAGKTEQAKEYGGRLCRLAVISGVVSGVVLLLFTPVILHFSNLNPAANQYLQWMLIMCTYYLIGKSVNSTTIAGIFCAGGDTGFGVRCDFVTMWCVIVPMSMLAAFVWKLPVLAVYFLINLDEMIKLPAVYRHYKQYGWLQNITRKQEKKEN